MGTMVARRRYPFHQGAGSGAAAPHLRCTVRQQVCVSHRPHHRALLDAQLHVQLIRSSNEPLVGAALKGANTWDAALLPHNRDYYERRKYGGVVSSDTRSPAAPIRLTLCAAMRQTCTGRTVVQCVPPPPAKPRSTWSATTSSALYRVVQQRSYEMWEACLRGYHSGGRQRGRVPWRSFS